MKTKHWIFSLIMAVITLTVFAARIQTPIKLYNPVTGTTDTVDASAAGGSFDLSDIGTNTTNNAGTVAVHSDVTADQATAIGNLTNTNSGDQTSIVGLTGTVAEFSTAITDATLSGNNTGDQSSIVGITGTAAEFNTSMSDGSFATGGGTATGTNTGDQTNISGNAATVTTNADLTGHIVSTGNASLLGAFTLAQLNTAISDATLSDATGQNYLIIPQTSFMSGSSANVVRYVIGDGGLAVPAGPDLFVEVTIPEGKKVTHVDLWDDSDDRAVEIWEKDITDGTMVSKGTGNANTQVDITDVNATSTNIIVIEYDAVAAEDRLFGAKLTLADI